MTTELQLPPHRRSRLPVLIIEDRVENQVLLKGLCREFDVPSVVAENGQAALDLIKSGQSFSIYIVDLMMPVMDGITFIQELRQIEPEAVVLVQTALDESDTIIRTMKLGVFDYVIKPIESDLFLQTMRKASEYRYLKEMERALAENAGRKLRGQLEWLLHREGGANDAQQAIDSAAIHNLKTSLTQGEGVGTMVTLIDMLESLARREGDSYIIPKELAEELFANNQRTRMALQGLDRIVEVLQRKPKFESITAGEVQGMIEDAWKELQPYAGKRELSVNLPVDAYTGRMNVDRALLAQSVHEVLLNAMKYAPSAGSVDVALSSSEGYFCVAVQNTIEENARIPREYERLVTEPFFRNAPVMEDATSYEQFGLGLGLTVVDYILKKHNGLFFIQEQNYESEDGAGAMGALAQLYIPEIVVD